MSVGTYSLAREGDKLLSPHFRVREFACRDGADLVKIDTDLVELLEREGAEAVVPDLMDFFNYSFYGGFFKHRYLGLKWTSSAVARLVVSAIRVARGPAIDALSRSRRFEAPMPIEQIAALAEPFLAQGNQYGEGWFLAGEMAELLTTGVSNIVCIQPFACLPNHVVGKGVIKKLRAHYPDANIVAVDYDPGSSEANQLNRIKLMLAVAKKKAAQVHKPAEAAHSAAAQATYPSASSSSRPAAKPTRRAAYCVCRRS